MRIGSPPSPTLVHVLIPRGETDRSEQGDLQIPLICERSLRFLVVMSASSRSIITAEVEMRCPICIDSVVEPVVTECGHRFCRKCIVRSLRQFKRECPLCRRFIASHRVLKPWVEDERSAHDLKENASIAVLEGGWICSTCTLQNSVCEAHCTACLARGAINLLKRDRPLLSSGKSCADGASTESGVIGRGTWIRGHGGKVARVAQPAVTESPLAAGISGVSEGLVVGAVVLMGRPISKDSLHDPIITECGHRPSRNRKSPSRYRALLSPGTTSADTSLVPEAVNPSGVPTAHVAAHLLTSLKLVRRHIAPPAHATSREVVPKRGTPKKRCGHGRQRYSCKECGGAGICEHGRRRGSCKECGGAGICEHGRHRQQCKECGGASICEHGRLRYSCKECGGAGICEHGRLQTNNSIIL